MAAPTQDQIRERAYRLYLERGCQDGRALDDWLTAEMELLVDNADSEECLVRRAREAALAAVPRQSADRN